MHLFIHRVGARWSDGWIRRTRFRTQSWHLFNAWRIRQKGFLASWLFGGPLNMSSSGSPTGDAHKFPVTQKAFYWSETWFTFILWSGGSLWVVSDAEVTSWINLSNIVNYVNFWKFNISSGSAVSDGAGFLCNDVVGLVNGLSNRSVNLLLATAP